MIRPLHVFSAPSIALLCAMVLYGVAATSARAQGPPPAKVVLAPVKAGEVYPTQTFVGTVFFPEVSEVAAEVSGRVEALDIETGSRVTRGQRLVALSTDIPQKELESAVASHRQLLSQLDIANIELRRMEQLIKLQTVSEQEYDRARFLVQRLEREASSLQARAELLAIKVEKAMPVALYDGVVLERHVGRGEWLSPGDPIATLARDDYVEVLVDLPGDKLRFIQPGAILAVEAGGRARNATVEAIIPRGNVATRTFPLKLTITDVQGPPFPLVQGMEARVDVPSADKVDALLVPRDAVLLSRGQHVVWVNADGTAAQAPVQVLAYQDMHAAVIPTTPQSPLAAGRQVVIKGNERLRPGQPLAPKGGE